MQVNSLLLCFRNVIENAYQSNCNRVFSTPLSMPFYRCFGKILAMSYSKRPLVGVVTAMTLYWPRPHNFFIWTDKTLFINWTAQSFPVYLLLAIHDSGVPAIQVIPMPDRVEGALRVHAIGPGSAANLYFRTARPTPRACPHPLNLPCRAPPPPRGKGISWEAATTDPESKPPLFIIQTNEISNRSHSFTKIRLLLIGNLT